MQCTIISLSWKPQGRYFPDPETILVRTNSKTFIASDLSVIVKSSKFTVMYKLAGSASKHVVSFGVSKNGYMTLRNSTISRTGIVVVQHKERGRN